MKRLALVFLFLPLPFSDVTAQEETWLGKRIHLNLGAGAPYFFGYGIQGEVWLNQLLFGVRLTRQREALRGFPRLLSTGKRSAGDGITELGCLTGTGFVIPDLGFLSIALGLGAGIPSGTRAPTSFVGMAWEVRVIRPPGITASFYGNWNAETPYYGMMIGVTISFE